MSDLNRLGRIAAHKYAIWRDRFEEVDRAISREKQARQELVAANEAYQRGSRTGETNE